MSALPAGRHFFRGDDGYETARRGTVWNQRVPERYPDVIVQAVDADDATLIVDDGHRIAGFTHATGAGRMIERDRAGADPIAQERGVGDQRVEIRPGADMVFQKPLA